MQPTPHATALGACACGGRSLCNVSRSVMHIALLHKPSPGAAFNVMKTITTNRLLQTRYLRLVLAARDPLIHASQFSHSKKLIVHAEHYDHAELHTDATMRLLWAPIASAVCRRSTCASLEAPMLACNAGQGSRR